MKSDDADILLSGTLLRLYQTSGTVNADDETAGNLGVESAGVTGSLNPKNTLDPSDNFVGRRVGGLVEVDDTAGDV